MAKPIKKPIWNNMDAFALLNGISTWDKNYETLLYSRLPGESNIELKKRILNFRDRKITGCKLQDIINGIANELNIPALNLTKKDIFYLSYVPVDDFFNASYLTKEDFEKYKNLEPVNWEEYDSSHYNIPEETQIFILKNKNIPNNCVFKFEYNIRVFKDGEYKIIKYVDIDMYGDRFTYYKPDVITLDDKSITTDSPVVYTIDSIPTELKSVYYDGEKPKDFMFTVVDYKDTMTKHTWGNLTDKMTIWDINKGFTKDVIPSFYNEVLPTNPSYTSGVTEYTTALYIKGIEIVYEVVNDVDIEKWHPIIYPGEFYIKGKKYYFMENGKYSPKSSGSNSILIPNLKPYHKVIVYKTPQPTGEAFKDYDYHISTSSNITLRESLYNITFGINGGTITFKDNNQYHIYYDDTEYPTGKICTSVDLNPLNDSMGFKDYFINIIEE